MLSLFLIEFFQVVHVLFFRGFEGVANLQLPFLITVKIISSHSMEVILIVISNIIMTLLMNFSWFDLESWIDLCSGRFEYGELLMDLNFYETEEKIDYADRIEFFVLVKVYESERWYFGFTSPDSLNFYFHKIYIFF